MSEQIKLMIITTIPRDFSKPPKQMHKVRDPRRPCGGDTESTTMATSPSLP